MRLNANPVLDRRLVDAVFGSAGLRMAGMGFGFLVGVQLARLLGADGYGAYGVAMSIISLLAVPTEFGFPQLLTREVASASAHEDWRRVKGALAWATSRSILISIVVIAGVTTWLGFSRESISSQFTPALMVGVFMTPLVAQASLRAAALRGLHRVVLGQIPDVVLRPMSFSFILFVLALMQVPLSPSRAMAACVLSAAIACGAAVLLLRRELPPEVGRAVPVCDSKAWWMSAFPMAMTDGMVVLQSHALILILGAMVSTAEVGTYRVASSIAVTASVSFSIFSVIGAPRFASLYATGSSKELQRSVSLIAGLMVVGVSIVCLPLIIFGGQLVSGIFGSEYAASVTPLKILSAGLLLSSLFGPGATLLNMISMQKKVTQATLLSLALVLCASPPCIHFYGVNGAAIASAAAMIVWKALLWRFAFVDTGVDTSPFKLRRGSGV